MDLAERIKHIRVSKRIKQSEIAESLGIDPQNYSRLEKRGNKLTLEQIEKISKSLNVSTLELLGLEDSTRSSLKEIEELEDIIKQKDRTIVELTNKLNIQNLDFDVSMLFDEVARHYSIGKIIGSFEDDGEGGEMYGEQYIYTKKDINNLIIKLREYDRRQYEWVMTFLHRDLISPKCEFYEALKKHSILIQKQFNQKMEEYEKQQKDMKL